MMKLQCEKLTRWIYLGTKSILQRWNQIASFATSSLIQKQDTTFYNVNLSKLHFALKPQRDDVPKKHLFWPLANFNIASLNNVEMFCPQLANQKIQKKKKELVQTRNKLIIARRDYPLLCTFTKITSSKFYPGDQPIIWDGYTVVDGGNYWDGQAWRETAPSPH